ncbi:radical SAM protein [Chitinispirillales bacterium ANBcel5]|uniref:B12-binding domain-containing radical SAM protein n=1 Tax=Cellulosispirillum alkaliphilum TaxID=3039283 RepID=UPI002A50C2EA|nr:radical SAM protein [Chitinispirillales bacterium ANBcel5]
MKICLVRPPSFCKNLTYPSGPRFGLPLSLLYLGANLESVGHEVVLYDALSDLEIEDLRPDRDGSYHVGASWDKVALRVRECAPDLVGITNPFSDFVSCTIKCAEVIKENLPSAYIVVGGPHATSEPSAFLYDGSPVDYIMRAECESAVLSLCTALSKGGDLLKVPNLAYCRKGELQCNQLAPFLVDLDKLPLPAYHLADLEKSFELVKAGFPSRFSFAYPGSHREVSLITSRGCPFGCIFCGNHLHMGRRWRYHSVGYIMRHMELLVLHYGVRHFHIEDDNLGLDPKRFETFLDALLAKEWNITWDTPNGIRADRLPPALLEKVKASGCTYLIFGIESGNQKVLDTIVKKNLRLDDVTKSARYAKRCRLDVHAFYVVGFPGETRREIVDTFRYALKMLALYDVIPHLCLARPLPGTSLFEMCQEKGFLTEPVLPQIGKGLRGELFARRMIRTSDFSPAQLEKWVSSFNRKVITLIILKSAIFLLFHPRVAKQAIGGALSSSGVKSALLKIFFGGLFYKFNYLNPRLRQKKSRVA